MLCRELALDEARKQKEALAELGSWRRYLFLLTTSLSALAVLGFQMADRPALGIAAVIAAAVCLTLTGLVDLSIRNGRRNVEKILDSLQQS